uniref:Gamma tubulin complex component protein N-terminal domain-containing protein n=1 Tax=Plectus sambesii TaxID=2011161 RepID=A0A914WJW1_9BILA
MLSRTEKFVKSFDISCSRKEAIGAFFQPLLESSAAAHPSVASQSPSTGALFLSAINCFNVRNHHETAQRLIKINDELKDHDSVCRFLLLLTNLPREQKAAESRKALVGLTPVKEELPPFPTVFPKEQISVATPDIRLERSSKNTPSREISSPDQGIDLEESPKSADCDSLERLSFIETLVALHPNRTWIKTPKSEVVFCLLRLFGGHETWLFPFHSQKCEFVMKEGAFLDGLSPAAFKNSLQLVLNASNCLVRLEKCSESKSESCSLPVRAFKYALGDYVRRKREAAGNVLSRNENTLFHALHHVKRLCREIALVTDTMLQLVTSEITSQELVDRICDVRGLFSADASTAQAINDLLSAVCKQLNRSLNAWLTTGVTQEKSFIVSESAESSSVRERLQSREFWRTDYGISLPPFGLITASLSSDILAVGKVRRLANEWDQFRLNYDVQLDTKNDNSTCKTVIADQNDVDEDLKADDFQLRLIYSIERRVRSAQRDPCLLACLSKAREMFHENLLLLRRVFFQEDRLLAA